MVENDDIFAFFTCHSGSVEDNDPGLFEPLAIAGSAGIVGIVEVKVLTKSSRFGTKLFHGWDKSICVAVMLWNFRGFRGFLAFFTG